MKKMKTGPDKLKKGEKPMYDFDPQSKGYAESKKKEINMLEDANLEIKRRGLKVPK